MTRTQPSFSQLIGYMEKENTQEEYNLRHNLYSEESQDIKQEFANNASYIKTRKNGVYLYHEILSISRTQELETEKQKEILKKIASDYLHRRAKHNLAYGILHDDKKEHLHYHLLISANEIRQSKKTRLSKKEFDTIKKEIEADTLEKYPEIKQKISINKEAKYKRSIKETALKTRTKKPSQRDDFRAKLKRVFTTIYKKQDFQKILLSYDIKYYKRGKTIGFIDLNTSRKYRLKTLQLEQELKALNTRLTQTKHPQTDREKFIKTAKEKLVSQRIARTTKSNAKTQK